MQCPRCSHENPPDARFCNACAASLEADSAPASTSAETSHTDFLQRYIPRALADKMRQLGGQVESERRHVTVVFADISGFTAMSEKLDPEEVTHLINACFKTLVEVIFKYEGTIDKFIGDEIMALFGAPIAHENDPERAIRAALEMQARLREFNANLKTPLPKPLTMHVGINSGEVIAGNVGSDLRMDYSVLGDTVNLAARLESVSVSGQILVSERTHALTRHLFEFKKLKPFKVQGKQRKVQAYQVLGVKAVPERGRGVAEGYGPLVGRQEELEQLRQIADRVRQGQGQVVGLVGDAGIGKSRLVYELQQLVPEFTQVSGACVSYEVPASYQVFTDVLGSLLSLAPDDDEFVVRRKLEAWAIARDLDEEHRPFLGSLFGLRDERLVYLQDEERYQQVQDTVLEVLRILASPQPLLLVLEDLHWIDTPSRRLLEGLVAGVGALPVLICGAYRPEFQPAWKDHPACHILPVGPLPASETSQLAQGLLKLALPPELEHLLVERTEGNPFFVEELLKALIDEGVIARTRTGFELKKDVRTVQLPDTIHGVILARLDRLEAQTRDTLQYASVIGRRFSQALLQAVSPRAQHIEEDLRQLQSLELVYQHRLLPDLEFIFKHFVTREVAYNNVLAKRRKAIHLEVARSIEKIYHDRLEDYYEALAHHFEAGEDWQKAAEYYKQAGSKARELHADEGATAFLEKREQVVQKVFEQQEERSIRRLLGIGCIIFLALEYLVFLGIDISAGRPLAWHNLFGLAGCLMMWFVFRRTRTADAVTIYTDCLEIRTRKGLLRILFADIGQVRFNSGAQDDLGSWKGLRRIWTDRKTFRKTFRKATRILGTSSWRRGVSYHAIDFLAIALRDGRPLVIESLNAGALYRELRLTMSRWAAARQVEITDLFASNASRFEDHHHLTLRQRDGTPLTPITYDHLLERIERAEVGTTDQIALRGEDTWVALKEAGQEDRRLLAALYPLRQALRELLQQLGLVFVVSSIVYIGVLVFTKIPVFTEISIILVTSVLLPAVANLRSRFLVWSRRLRLSRWQDRGLRLLSALAVPVILVALGAGVAGILGLGTDFSMTRFGAHERPVSQAVPLANLRIDGRLDDWPQTVKQYPIQINEGAYGATDLDGQDLNTSPDLSPHFRVGYNPTDNLLYLAVRVQDDSLVVGGADEKHTDACVVYVDGAHRRTTAPFYRQIWGSAADLAALRYVGIPGPGTFGEGYEGNPALFRAKPGSTRTQMAYTRQGDITTYEWAIEAFDHYPDAPSQLVDGKIIGFDVYAVDKDGQDDTSAWVCWAAPGGPKLSDAGLLGDLVLVEKPEDVPADSVSNP